MTLMCKLYFGILHSADSSGKRAVVGDGDRLPRTRSRTLHASADKNYRSLIAVASGMGAER